MFIHTCQLALVSTDKIHFASQNELIKQDLHNVIFYSTDPNQSANTIKLPKTFHLWWIWNFWGLGSFSCLFLIQSYILGIVEILEFWKNMVQWSLTWKWPVWTHSTHIAQKSNIKARGGCSCLSPPCCSIWRLALELGCRSSLEDQSYGLQLHCWVPGQLLGGSLPALASPRDRIWRAVLLVWSRLLLVANGTGHGMYKTTW